MELINLKTRVIFSRYILHLFLVLLALCSIMFQHSCRNLENIPIIEMVRIEGGEFMMGSVSGRIKEFPIHRVRVDSFYLGRTEITVAQWRAFIENTGYITDAQKWHNGMVKIKNKRRIRRDANWNNPYLIQNDLHPVVLISWHDACAFCQWLSEKTGRPYRLPTEAEWEFACNGGTTGDYFGDLASYAWYEYNSNGSTHPVGQKRPNSLGLYDMLGNVWEWCQDRYSDNYYSVSPRQNPPGSETGKHRVSRGGSWCSKPERIRSSFRKHNTPFFSFYRQGFRVAYSDEPIQGK